MNRPLLSLTFSILALTACQARQFESQTWRKSDGPPPGWAKRNDFQPMQREIRIGAETVKAAQQQSHGLRVQGSLQRTIYKNGEPVWIGQNAVDKPLKLLQQARVLAAKANQNNVETTITERLQADGMNPVDSPELMIQQIDTRFEPRFVVHAFQSQSAEFFEYTFEPSGELEKRIPVGYALTTQTLPTQIFPLGPKRSALSWVDISVQREAAFLTSPLLTVKSQTGIEVRPSEDVLRFPLNDPRFDQVQVFFFVEEFLKTLKDRHAFELPRPLKIETHVGYPEKTNAAFYYQSVVRLGTGDGVHYQDQMRDPTIVLHEVGHAIIDALTNLPFSGEGGSIHEGLSDFFAASYLKTPLMAEASYLGGPFKRRVDNEKTWDDRIGKMYADSQVISGLFWKLRTKLGEEKSERLALRVLPRLMPSANLTDFKTELLLLIDELPEADRRVAESVLTEKKWR